jgi:hypothetical protein
MSPIWLDIPILADVKPGVFPERTVFLQSSHEAGV